MEFALSSPIPSHRKSCKSLDPRDICHWRWPEHNYWVHYLCSKPNESGSTLRLVRGIRNANNCDKGRMKFNLKGIHCGWPRACRVIGYAPCHLGASILVGNQGGHRAEQYGGQRSGADWSIHPGLGSFPRGNIWTWLQERTRMTTGGRVEERRASQLVAWPKQGIASKNNN